MNKYFKFVVIAGAVLVGFRILFVRDIEDINSTSSKSSPVYGYTLKQPELAIFHTILKNEAVAFANGDDSLLKDGLLSSSTTEIQKAYNENEVAADVKYYGRTIFLTGTIQSINSGLGNEPYIVFRGTNQFISPIARFDNGGLEKIVALKKGEKINLVCSGGGSIVGTAIFKRCKFAADYAVQKASGIQEEVADFLEGKRTVSKYAELLTLTTIAAYRTLPDTSICFVGTDENGCLAEINAIKDDVMQNMDSVVTDLKSQGVRAS